MLSNPVMNVTELSVLDSVNHKSTIFFVLDQSIFVVEIGLFLYVKFDLRHACASHSHTVWELACKTSKVQDS